KIIAASIFFPALTLLFRDSAADAAQAKVDFARDIRPIFQARCDRCHGARSAMAQLRLDDRQSAMKVIRSGNRPGDGKNSRLLQRLLGEGGEARMPLGGEPLKPEQIELIRRWIDEGAEWPEQAQRGEGERGRGR